MAEEEVAALVVNIGTGLGFAGFAGLDAQMLRLLMSIFIRNLCIISLSPLYFADFSAVRSLR